MFALMAAMANGQWLYQSVASHMKFSSEVWSELGYLILSDDERGLLTSDLDVRIDL